MGLICEHGSCPSFPPTSELSLWNSISVCRWTKVAKGHKDFICECGSHSGRPILFPACAILTSHLFPPSSLLSACSLLLQTGAFLWATRKEISKGFRFWYISNNRNCLPFNRSAYCAWNNMNSFLVTLSKMMISKEVASWFTYDLNLKGFVLMYYTKFISVLRLLSEVISVVLMLVPDLEKEELSFLSWLTFIN